MGIKGNRGYESLFGGASLVFVAAIWGFVCLVIKDSLAYISAPYMCALRFSLGAICASAACASKWKEINGSYILRAAVLGLFLFLSNLLQTIGCAYTSAGKSAFLVTVYVVLVPIFSGLFFGVKTPRIIFLAALIQMVGIAFLSLKITNKSELYMNVGDVLTLFSGAFGAMQLIFQEKYNEENGDPILLSCLTFIAVALFSWCVAPFYSGESNSFTKEIQSVPLSSLKNPRLIFSLLYMGILSTFLAFSLQNVALKYVPASIASLLISLESVFGMFFSIIFPVNGRREEVSVNLFIGCLLIFLALIIAKLPRNRFQKCVNP